MSSLIPSTMLSQIENQPQELHMKLVLTLFLTLSVSANSDFLSPSEAKSVSDYMYDICMDTYCGGDFLYFNDVMKCHENTCEIEMSAHAYIEEGVTFSDKLSELSNSSVTLNQTVIKYKGIDTDSDEERGKFQNASFTCLMPNLPTKSMTLYEKQELIYDLIVFECVNAFENEAY